MEATSSAVVAQNPPSSKLSLNMTLVEPTGLFLGLVLVLVFACADWLLWFATAVASSLFLVRHLHTQWPSLPQWWHLPLWHLDVISGDA